MGDLPARRCPIFVPAQAISLLSAAAVRERAQRSSSTASPGGSRTSRSISTGCDACADEVAATIRAAYPTLARSPSTPAGGILPPAASIAGRRVADAAAWADAAALARAAFDLAIVSVLLDAGAGPGWRYRGGPHRARRYARSEGLAVASFDMFVGGAFSAGPRTRSGSTPRR